MWRLCDLSYTITIIQTLAIHKLTVLSTQDTVDCGSNGQLGTLLRLDPGFHSVQWGHVFALPSMRI